MLLLVRYSEIGLKSTPVRRMFESQLRDNMMSMLSRDGIEAIISSAEARFFVESENLDAAADSIRRVFGVASVSKAELCGSDMEEICKTAAEYSRGKIKKGQSFAVKARREGTHRYNSMDLGREAGSAIFLSNKNIKVDLTEPDVTFFIEVRNNKAYIFHEYLPGPGGLPLGCQGKVIAAVNDERGLLSAWMMMKRGCRAYVCGSYDVTLLRRYDPALKVIGEGDSVNGVLGKVMGTSLNELDSVDASDVPLYFPTIGMSDDEVKETLRSIY